MDYLYIRAWGKVMSSLPYYIRDQLATAHEDKAPGNAIYKNEEGLWMTMDDIKDGNTRRQVEQVAARIQKQANPQHPLLPPRTII
jgi:hypothetical protein